MKIKNIVLFYRKRMESQVKMQFEFIYSRIETVCTDLSVKACFLFFHEKPLLHCNTFLLTDTGRQALLYYILQASHTIFLHRHCAVLIRKSKKSQWKVLWIFINGSLLLRWIKYMKSYIPCKHCNRHTFASPEHLMLGIESTSPHHHHYQQKKRYSLLFFL